MKCKRNSTTLFLESSGAITPVPWVNNAPDFSIYSEPTLSVLQSVWQQFLDSDEELEVIPDPEPFVEPPQPDWDSFNLTFSTLPSLIQAEVVANQNHPSIVGKKDLAYSMINQHGVTAFAMIFPLFCQYGGVGSDTRIEWAELAEAFNMPDDFVSIIRG